jgi:glycosyltransferase involved in cell wall biosynthesis
MSNITNVLHVVERIDDKYGGPAKSIPYTCWSATSRTIKHEIFAGRYHRDDHNSVCDHLGLAYKQFKILGSTKIAFSPSLCRAIFMFVCTKENPVVHVHNAWNFVPFIVWFLSLIFHFKIIVSVRGALSPWSLEQGRTRKKIAWVLFQKRLLRKADVIHVTSKIEREQVGLLSNSDNLVVIPNGVLLEKNSILQNVHEKKLLDDRPLQILFASRIHPKKGLELLISALGSEKINFEVELLIAGEFSDETYQNQIEGMLSQLRANVSTHFLGHQSTNELINLYRQVDLFVLPSYAENFGIAIAEALSYGLPVITSNNTPWQEIQLRGAGYIVETSVDQLISSITAFKNLDIYERIVMSENALSMIQDYDWRNLGKFYQSMYETI